MRIAVPLCQGRIVPALDTALQFLVVHSHRGEEVNRREIMLGLLSPEAMARSLAELRVNVLLCAALSKPLGDALKWRGIKVEPGLWGDAEYLLKAFDDGSIRQPEFRMPDCWTKVVVRPLVRPAKHLGKRAQAMAPDVTHFREPRKTRI